MRKPLIFLAAAAFLLVATTWWSADVPVIVGGKEMVALFRPESLPLLYGALALFALALVVTLAAAVRAWMHPAAPAESPAPPEENVLATD